MICPICDKILNQHTDYQDTGKTVAFCGKEYDHSHYITEFLDYNNRTEFINLGKMFICIYYANNISTKIYSNVIKNSIILNKDYSVSECIDKIRKLLLVS